MIHLDGIVKGKYDVQREGDHTPWEFLERLRKIEKGARIAIAIKPGMWNYPEYHGELEEVLIDDFGATLHKHYIGKAGVPLYVYIGYKGAAVGSVCEENYETGKNDAAVSVTMVIPTLETQITEETEGGKGKRRILAPIVIGYLLAEATIEAAILIYGIYLHREELKEAYQDDADDERKEKEQKKEESVHEEAGRKTKGFTDYEKMQNNIPMVMEELLPFRDRPIEITEAIERIARTKEDMPMNFLNNYGIGNENQLEDILEDQQDHEMLGYSSFELYKNWNELEEIYEESKKYDEGGENQTTTSVDRDPVRQEENIWAWAKYITKMESQTIIRRLGLDGKFCFADLDYSEIEKYVEDKFKDDLGVEGSKGEALLRIII